VEDVSMRYWLLKSEPDSYSIDDLEREGTASWDGVRNYMARNHLMAMKLGDLAFFHHSGANPPGIAGICKVVREHYPDHTQFDPSSKYFDPKATPDGPRWFMPDVGFVARFREVVPISVLRQTPGLQDMAMLQRGSRLSVTPVTSKEFEIICDLAGVSVP
jgi:predicted RNA-binding protein with PUA-like domain